MFFVISAFLITHLAILEYKKTQDFSVRKFLFRRALRLLPLYYLIVFLGFVVFPLLEIGIGPIYSDSRSYQSFIQALPFYVLFLSTLAKDFFGVNWGGVGGLLGPLWSIVVEIHFYLLFSILFVLIMKFVRKRLQTNRVPVFLLIAAYLSISIFIKALAFNEFGVQVFYGNLPGALDSFAFGIILSFAYNTNEFQKLLAILSRNWKYQTLLIMAIYTMYRLVSKFPHVTTITSFGDLAIVYILAAIISSSIVVFALSLDRLEWRDDSRAIPFLLGDIVGFVA